MHDDLFGEMERVVDAGNAILEAGMRFNAGHALNYTNVKAIAALPGVSELHIGHAIVARAVYVGLRQAVREMKDAMASSAEVIDLPHDHEED
jgi:pyridoxine 5-phosphate synthase